MSTHPTHIQPQGDVEAKVHHEGTLVAHSVYHLAKDENTHTRIMFNNKSPILMTNKHLILLSLDSPIEHPNFTVIPWDRATITIQRKPPGILIEVAPHPSTPDKKQRAHLLHAAPDNIDRLITYARKRGVRSRESQTPS